MKKKIIISTCNDCPFLVFNDDAFMIWCLKMNTELKDDFDNQTIPDNCPLETTNEDLTL